MAAATDRGLAFSGALRRPFILGRARVAHPVGIAPASIRAATLLLDLIRRPVVEARG